MTKFIDATTESVFKSAFLYIRNTQTQQISKVVAASDFQVGLTNLPKDLTVTGKAIFTQGISLVDNTPYLVAGSNITITTAPNGQVTIATTGAAIGDVEGPASATDNAIVRFNLTTGKLIQNSGVIIDDSNNITTAGDFAVNGGDITSSMTTFNLLNTTVTTLNVGGAATAIEIGAATGTTSINNALTVDGNTTLGNATSDTVTINGTTTFAGSAVTTTFNGDIAVNGGDFTTTAATMNLVNAATTINLGSTPVARTTNIATGADVQTVTLGSTTGASATTINAGTGVVTIASTTTSNADALIGAAEIGTHPYAGSNYAMFGHKDLNHAVDGNYALVQSNVGDTFLGAVADKIIYFKNGTKSLGYFYYSSFFAKTIFSLDGAVGSPTHVTIGSTHTTSNITINAGSGSIDIGTTPQSRTTDIATGAAAQTVTLGSTTGASSLTLNAGANGITMSSTSTTSADVIIGNIEIGQWPYTTSYCMIGHSTLNHTAVGNYAVLQSSTGDTYLNASSTKTLAFRINNVDSGYINASTISLTGGSGVATTVTLGSTTGASTLTLDAGTGDLNLGTSNSARTINIGSDPTGTATTQQTINIGAKNTSSFNMLHLIDEDSSNGHEIYILSDNGTQATGTSVVEIGTVAAATTIDIGNSTVGAKVVTIGGTGGASSLTLQAGTGTISIGVSAAARTTNIATGAAVQTVTLGSTTGASSLTLQAGTGNINIGNNTSWSTRTIAIGTGDGTSGQTQTVNIGAYNPNGTINVNINGDNVNIANTSGSKIGFFGLATPITKRTGVAITAAAIHAALVAYGLISA